MANQGNQEKLPRAHVLVISILLVSAFVVMLNETLVGVALPRIMHELKIDAGTAQWLVTAYMLTMAIVIPLTGFLMKRYSTRTVFIGAMAFFTLGTAVAAFAPFFVTLLLGRVLQAVGTGVMTPLLMTTIMTLIPADRRGRMMGMISIVMSVAPVLGPLIGGLIINWLHWQALFMLVLPIAVIALLLGVWLMRNVTETSKVRIDLLSVLLSVLAFGGLIFGLSEIGHDAEVDQVIPNWLPLVVGAAALLCFVLRQLQLQRSDEALIDLRIFGAKAFTRAVLMMVAINAILFGSLTLLPLYIQNGLGLSPLESGLIVLPGGLLMGLAGPFVGLAYDKVGARPLVIPGAMITSLALWFMAFLLTDQATFGLVLTLYMVLSAGLALLFAPLFTVALGSVPQKLYSYGSAGIGTVQQVAGAAGTALFMVVYSSASNQAVLDGAGDAAAVEAGTHYAFVLGAVLSLGLVALSFIIPKKSASEPGQPVVMH